MATASPMASGKSQLPFAYDWAVFLFFLSSCFWLLALFFFDEIYLDFLHNLESCFFTWNIIGLLNIELFLAR